MSFWGMSREGKDARGKIGEIGNWDFQQYKDWLNRQNQSWDKGTGNVDWATQYWKNRVSEGFPSPADTRSTGQQILPGVDNTIQANKDRWNQIWGSYGNLTPVSDTVSGINRNLDTGRTLADQTYGDMAKREDAYSTDIQNTIAGQYGSMEKNLGNAYKDMYDAANKTYGGLLDSSGKTYDEALKGLDVLRPGSEAAMATSSRAYAPAVAATMRRLRGMGIDPNSPEGNAALQRVESSRARAMEDAAVSQTKDYVEKSTGLKISKEQAKEALGLGQLQTTTGLQREGVGAITNLRREGTGLGINEKVRTLAAQQGISQDSLSNAQKWLSDKNNLETLRNSLERQDWGTASSILQGMNANDVQGLALLAEQYGLGQQQQILDLAQKNLGAANVGNIGQQQTQNAFQSANAAQGFGNQALNAYGNVYGIEAANAGWGSKALLNAGLAVATGGMYRPQQQQQNNGWSSGTQVDLSSGLPSGNQQGIPGYGTNPYWWYGA